MVVNLIPVSLSHKNKGELFYLFDKKEDIFEFHYRYGKEKNGVEVAKELVSNLFNVNRDWLTPKIIDAESYYESEYELETIVTYAVLVPQELSNGNWVSSTYIFGNPQCLTEKQHNLIRMASQMVL